jgi:GNAT superfamily N-acetyltransferase
MPQSPSQTHTSAFANPIWNALHASHRHFALTTPLACKYPADVSPFAALAEPSPAALLDLRSLLVPGEAVYASTGPLAVSTLPETPGLRLEAGVLCLQMAYPTTALIPPAETSPPIRTLTCADAPTMLALTHIAFPGYFRIRTCEMGSWFGIFDSEPPHPLIAMGGERFILSPQREISGLCTHPGHRGQAYATHLLTHILRHQRSLGAISCLHVAASNTTAIHLYHRLGFHDIGHILLHRILRPD